MKSQKSNLTDFQIAKQVSVCQQLDKVTGGETLGAATVGSALGLGMAMPGGALGVAM